MYIKEGQKFNMTFSKIYSVVTYFS